MPFPRRMFAGARIRFQRPLRLGTEATREATIADIQLKQGTSGALLFMSMRVSIRTDEGCAITEEQDIVYRAPAAGAVPAPVRRAQPAPVWVREVDANALLLFRYSALIFNAHRI